MCAGFALTDDVRHKAMGDRLDIRSGLTRRAFAVAAVGAIVSSFPACARMPEGVYLTINGDRQWLLTQGDGPTLLILHGGPGASETLLFRHFNQELEMRFRVAYWDQRGAGRSYDRANPPPNMTVEQFLRDLDVVVQHLRAAFGQPVILLGHSWGSALGLLYAHWKPMPFLP